jgi:hypothetical protein
MTGEGEGAVGSLGELDDPHDRADVGHGRSVRRRPGARDDEAGLVEG